MASSNFQKLLVSSQLRLRKCLYLVVGLITCVPLRPLTSYASGGLYNPGSLNQAGEVQGDGSGEHRHPGPQGLELGVGVTTLPRQKSKCYRNLHQLWQQKQRNPSNQINDRYWPNLIAAGNQHLEGRVSVAKGKDQSRLLECTHHASDRQACSRCNADKWILDGQYWDKPSKMDRIRNDEGKISKHGDTLRTKGNHHAESVAIIMSDKAAKALLEWKPLGERLVMARFNSKYAKLTVITFMRSQEMQRMQFKILFMTSYCNSFKRYYRLSAVCDWRFQCARSKRP